MESQSLSLNRDEFLKSIAVQLDCISGELEAISLIAKSQALPNCDSLVCRVKAVAKKSNCDSVHDSVDEQVEVLAKIPIRNIKARTEKLKAIVDSVSKTIRQLEIT